MNMKDILLHILPGVASYSVNAVKVLICIFIYYQFGLVWSIGLALFFTINLLSAIEKGIYDVEESQKEMNSAWSHIYSSRKRI